MKGEPGGAGSRIRAILSHILRFGLAVLIIVYFLWTGRLDVSSFALALASPGLLALSLFLMCVSLFISIERWRELLSALEFKVGIWLAARLTLIGLFFSVALPGVLGGDAVKAFYLARGRAQKAALVTTVIFDRIIGLYTMIVVAAGVSLWGIIINETLGPARPWWTGAVETLTWSILFIFMVSSAGLSMFLSRRLGKTWLMVLLLTKMPPHKLIVKLYTSIHRFRQKERKVAYAIWLSLLSQFFSYGSVYALAVALDIRQLDFIHYLFALPVCFLINAIPLAPGGLGVGEVGFGQIFALFGSTQGVALAALFHVLSYIIAIGGGGAAYFGRFNDAETGLIYNGDIQNMMVEDAPLAERRGENQ